MEIYKSPNHYNLVKMTSPGLRQQEDTSPHWGQQEHNLEWMIVG